MYRKKRRSRRKQGFIKKIRALGLIFVIFYLSLFVFALFRVNKIKPQLSHTAAALVFEEAVKGAVEENLDLLEKSEDETEEESFLSLDPVRLAEMKNSLTASLSQGLSSTRAIWVPSGSFTSLNMLEGTGLKVPVKMSFTGFGEAELCESFQSAGINQTLYTLRLKAGGKLVRSGAESEESFEFHSEYILIEKLIIGKVPEYFKDTL